MEYIQPRPSSIVAGLYTVRDLGVDVAILHGPSGCSFKHARLLEEDGLRVLTTSLADNEFIFGGHDILVKVLRYAEKEFKPRRIAVVGTCVAMIIGEDMQAAIDDSGISTPDDPARQCRRRARTCLSRPRNRLSSYWRLSEYCSYFLSLSVLRSRNP